MSNTQLVDVFVIFSVTFIGVIGIVVLMSYLGWVNIRIERRFVLYSSIILIGIIGMIIVGAVALSATLPQNQQAIVLKETEIAVNQQILTAIKDAGTPVAAQLQIKPSEKVECAQTSEGVYSCSVSGISSGLSKGGLSLLLWVRPVSPPSDVPGWYLQRPGIVKMDSDGSWTGNLQVGNTQWPPREGDVIDLAVTVVGTQTMKQLLTEREVVIRDQPIGIGSNTVPRVIVTLK